jgi:HAMP domain-containing protein
MYRRNLQKNYVDKLIAMMPSTTTPAPTAGFNIFFGPNTKNTDIPSVARGHLMELQSDLRNAIRRTNDKMSRYHLMDLAERINQALNPR